MSGTKPLLIVSHRKAGQSLKLNLRIAQRQKTDEKPHLRTKQPHEKENVHRLTLIKLTLTHQANLTNLTLNLANQPLTKQAPDQKQVKRQFQPRLKTHLRTAQKSHPHPR